VSQRPRFLLVHSKLGVPKAAGADGGLWFTKYPRAKSIGRITTSGW
jgi:hypothetical protein